MPLSFSLNFKHAVLNISFQFFDPLCFKRKPSKMFFVMLLFLEQFQNPPTAMPALAQRQSARELARTCDGGAHSKLARWSFFSGCRIPAAACQAPRWPVLHRQRRPRIARTSPEHRQRIARQIASANMYQYAPNRSEPKN